ncbi:MAG: hypothetical protein JWP08_1549, partial [Bryobacterales bacterium]|nr:hypothetical protein [Bryobacterales bacterium]
MVPPAKALRRDHDAQIKPVTFLIVLNMNLRRCNRKSFCLQLKMEWSPALRQVVKAQNPLNGRIEPGVITPTVHERV